MRLLRRREFVTCIFGALGVAATFRTSKEIPRIEAEPDGRGFLLNGSRFVPWGFNYDHDEQDRLIEDYWENEWPKVEEDFREMRELGANVVRIHLQFARFMTSPTKSNSRSLAPLRRLLRLAEELQLYLDITGLGCYHKRDVPRWYDELPEAERWKAQAAFWRAVAWECRESSAIFCYDLMNEPVAPPASGQRAEWLGPPFAGKHFVQWIALESKGRGRSEIARAWIRQLTSAIREVDRRHLITVGLVPWSLDRPGLSSGFVPEQIAPGLDFLSVHLYPEKAKVDEAIETLKAFAVGQPLLVEETFPLNCSPEEFAEFFARSRGTAAGWIGFYWGRTLDECRKSESIRDQLTSSWLEFFKDNSPIKDGELKSNTK